MTTLVGELLDRAAAALPARDEERRQGWWLRHSDSSMWWAGAVLAHGPAASTALEDGIDAAERFYLAHGAVPRFQVCPACPAELDAALSDRGYVRGPAVALLTGASTEVMDDSASSRLSARVDEELQPTWFEAWRAVHAPDLDAAPELRLLAHVDRPTAYAMVRADGEVVAVGRAVADGEWAGVFGMATLSRARGLGAAGATLVALARWADAHRSPLLYTQVMQENLAARRVFENAGFAELAAYHYRTGRSRHPTDGARRA